MATDAMVIDNVDKTEATKNISPLQQGLHFMKDKDVLTSVKDSMSTLAGMIQSDPSRGFDAIHANIPWKTICIDYLKSLPIRNIMVNNGDVGSLFMWVDSAYMDKAVDVMRSWGFEFKSVLHVVAFDRPVVEKPTVAAATGTATKSEDEGDEKIASTEEQATDAASVAATQTRVPRKQAVPPGWSTEGLIPSRTRQLWYAETVPSATSTDTTTASRFLKDPSFIRKRLAQVSTFLYPNETDDAWVTTLSAKKKNIEHWKVFPEYDVFIPSTLKTILEQIFKPTARVLSLFGDGLCRQWFSCGPNVPGYFSGPLRSDSGFPLSTVLLKSLSNIKLVTVHKYLTLINQYAVQMGKQLGSTEDMSIGPLLDGRIGEFIDELCTKAESGGGVRENPLSGASRIQLMSAEAFRQLDPILKTQFILMIAQVIRAVFKKNAEAADRRRRVGKRKRPVEDDGQPTVQRKFGIAAPVKISPKLATFMDLEPGAKMARTAVVKFINEYIKQHNLQNPDKKNNILLDAKLTDLLEPDENFGPVTYFNLCRLLKHHFLPVRPEEESVEKCNTETTTAAAPVGA